MANGGNNTNTQQYEQGQQEFYAQLQQQQQQQQQQPPLQNDSHSVILVTAGYDNTIRFWEALSGICSRTIKHPDSVGSAFGIGMAITLNDILLEGTASQSVMHFS